MPRAHTQYTFPEVITSARDGGGCPGPAVDMDTQANSYGMPSLPCHAMSNAIVVGEQGGGSTPCRVRCRNRGKGLSQTGPPPMLRGAPTIRSNVYPHGLVSYAVQVEAHARCIRDAVSTRPSKQPVMRRSGTGTNVNLRTRAVTMQQDKSPTAWEARTVRVYAFGRIIGQPDGPAGSERKKHRRLGSQESQS